VASNSLSRFTPVRGKEIRHVARLDLITSRGQALSCGPDLDPEVFAGVVGGFGYLGAVTRVDVALDKGAPEAVQTEIIGLLPLADVLAGLRATTSGAADMWTPTRYAVLLPGLARGFLFESSYLARATRWRRYWPVHAPRSLGHLLTQVLLRNGTLSRLTWSLSTQVWSRRPYVDPIHDFTFMMNGNVRLVRLGRRTGRAMGCAQQTFIVPLGVAPVQPAAAATEFLGHARDIFARHRLTPALTDVLSVPADDGILSSSAKLDGLAITFGFETSRRAELACIRDAFRKLATICGRLGGRVHLVKNVVADPAVLASMYAEAIPRFRALKERLDPDHVLRNDFLRTHFPALAGP
jgi:FAD/FMN-containing dehydrogenase